MNELFFTRLPGWQRRAWQTGGVAGLLWLLGVLLQRGPAFQAWWLAWVFWSGLSLGALSLLLLPYVVRSAWSESTGPITAAAAGALPLMALLFLPALGGLSYIFPWARVAPVTPHQHAFLSPVWFGLRGLSYLGLLSALPWLLERRVRTGLITGGGLVLYGAVMLFAATDWLMSLEPRWVSTILVVIAMSWQFLTALAFCVMLVTSFGDAGEKQLHDLGNLLLAFVTFWIYVSFSQYLIIWSGNLPHEISWYLHRSHGGWPFVALALALLQFAVPFALLLSRAAKRHARRLRPIAALIFGSGILQVYWLVAPAFSPERLSLHWLNPVAFVAIGGLWVALFLELMRRRPLLPPFDQEVPGA